MLVNLEHTEEEMVGMFDAVHSEGYIGYWGKSSAIAKNAFGALYFTVVERDDYDREVHYLHLSTVLKALGEVASGKHTNRRIANDALSAVTHDIGMLDADVADAVIQVACFGELRYG